MLTGIYAAEETRDAVAAESYIADFINSVYLANGAAVTAADVVSNPELIGVNGLQIGSNNSYGIVSILNDFLAVLLTVNWTAVIGFELTDTFPAAPLTVTDNTGGEDFLFVASMNDDYPAYVWDTVDQDGRREVFDGAGSRGAGIHRLAVTRTQARIAMSVDHEPVIANENPAATITGSVLLAQFGGYPDLYAWNDDIRIRYFEVRPVPVSDSVLRTL